MLIANGELERNACPSPLFAFNYLGQFDQSLKRDGRFSFAEESGGEAFSSSQLPDYAVDVNALVSEGKLSVSWRYRTDLVDDETARQLANAFEVRLRALVDHCLSAGAGATASDFPLAGLVENQLESLGLPLGDIQDIYPATPLQNGMLFHSLRQPGHGFYINQRRFTVSGELDIAALHHAWDTIVARHDVLRTAFRWKHDGPSLQIVFRKVKLPFVECDWTQCSQLDYEARLADWCKQDIAKDFELEHAPLLRVGLFHRHDGQYDLVWTDHHALTDGWSTAQLFGELWHYYHARASGQVARLAAPLQYREHVAWLRTRDDPAPWWLSRIARIEDPALLTESLPRRSTGVAEHGTLQSGVIEYTLDERRQAALIAATQRFRVTLSTLVQGTWAMLLSRYGHRAQVAFGVTVSGRENDLPGADRIVGLFINSLPMWVDVPGSVRLHTWLGDLQEYGSELRERSFTPLADVQRWSGRSGDALFDSLVVVENYSVDKDIRDRDIGLSLSDTSVVERTHYPLVLAVLPGSAIGLRWKFDPARLDATIVERLSRHYVEILDQVCAGEDLHLGEITLDGPRRHEQARCDHAFDPVARRVGAQAQMSPHAPALHCEGQRLSYAELDGWANRIARRLERLGVRADERVGVCMQRAPGLVAALLGVMKSGGAFVPLDPEYPEDRLAYMIADAGVKRVLVDDVTSVRLGTLLEGSETLRVDIVDDESPDPFDAPVHPDQLAYVIYTSGSTGRPKGVGISQRSLSLHLDDFLQTYRITSDDKQLQSSTVNFDVALHEMLPALMRGGQIEMRGPQLWDLETTSRHLADEHVSFSRIPTAYWQQWLLDPPAPERLAHLRQITVGGEGLPGDALRQWRAGPLGHIRLDNLYGPTETTVACMYRETTADDVNQPIVSIGRPYPSRSVYVLDGYGNEAPVGALGELCIGGETLARGYLNRAAQTAEKFIPDPFRADGGRLYRTGDLCRRREDGTIDFLGRMDQQVKLRGFRIELGEIESELRHVEGVREAAVELRGEGDGKRLVGYVAGTAGEAEVRRGIEGVLPGYMVPSAFVMLERLPVMPNGKVDRKALPEPVAASQSYEAPQGEVEEALARIWCEVLGVERIGRFDNFFEIGGHSLAAIRVSHLAEVRGVKGLTLEALFSHPSVAALADCIRHNSHRPANIVPLNKLGAPRNLFALHPLYGLVAEYRNLAGSLADVANVYGIQSPHYTDSSWWPTTLEEVAEAYADAILGVQPEGEFSLLGWSLGGVLAVEVAASLERRGHTVEFIALVDAGPPDAIVDSEALQSRSLKQNEYHSADVSHLRKFLDEEESWREFLPEENTEVLLQHIALVSKHFEALTRARCAKRLRVLPQRWRAARSEDSSSRANDRWKQYLGEELPVAAVIDSDHEDILDKPEFVEQLRDSLLAVASCGS